MNNIFIVLIQISVIKLFSNNINVKVVYLQYYSQIILIFVFIDKPSPIF